MSWLRWWDGTVTDPKWRVVAARSRQPVGNVLAVWAYLLEEARRSDGALPELDCEIIGACLGYEPDHVAAIIAAMRDKNSLNNEGVTNWRKRQPKRDDDSRERVREWRDKQKQGLKPVTVTHGNAPVTHGNAPEENRIESETEEKIENKKEARLRAPRLPDGNLDFEKWWQAWPNKVGKPAAENKFAAALKRASLETLLDGVQLYIRDKPPDRPWLNPATWLNQERWTDAPAAVAPRLRAGAPGRRNGFFALADKLAGARTDEPVADQDPRFDLDLKAG